MTAAEEIAQDGVTMAVGTRTRLRTSPPPSPPTTTPAFKILANFKIGILQSFWFKTPIYFYFVHYSWSFLWPGMAGIVEVNISFIRLVIGKWPTRT